MTHRIGNRNIPETIINSIYLSALFIGIFLLLDAELKDEIVKDLPEIPGVFFSSVTGEGINTLKDIIWKTLTSY